MSNLSGINNKPIIFAQISDSHLCAQQDSLHHGHNVFINLKKVLAHIGSNPEIDYIVFTGDLTQDHSEESYKNFVIAVQETFLEIPLYYLAGNHDEPELLAKYFSTAIFKPDTTINHANWQIQLIDSKSETPAGNVSITELKALKQRVDSNKYQLLMMHHHPIDVGYFIDKHGLQNKAQFWQTVNEYDNIIGVACGHVHGAKVLNKKLSGSNKQVTLYTCPATSIQFDPSADGVAALTKGPGYRLYLLQPNGSIQTDVINL